MSRYKVVSRKEHLEAAEDLGNRIDRLAEKCFTVSKRLFIVSFALFVIWFTIGDYLEKFYFGFVFEAIALGVIMWLADGALVYAVRFIPHRSIPRIAYRVLLTGCWIVLLVRPEMPMLAKLVLLPFCFSALLWGNKTDGLVRRYKALKEEFRDEHASANSKG